MNVIDKTKNFLSKFKYEYNILKSLICIAVLSLVCVIMQTIGQNGYIPSGYLTLITSPLVILFNFLPIFLIMTMLYCITNRVWVSYLITDILLVAALFVNHYKVIYRAESFKFLDLILVGEAFNITKNYTFPFSPKLFIVCAISIFILVAIIYTIKNIKTSVFIRGIIFTIDIALMVGLYVGVYSNKSLYEWIPSFAGEYNEVSANNNKGLVYSFLVSTTDVGYPKPEGYDENIYEEVLDIFTEEENDYNPNVIAVMSEAFFDLEDCEKARFYPGLKPMQNFNKLKSSSRWGYMIVPGFGGSTASTEFEFLTGANVSLISKSMPAVYNTHINSSLYCLPQLFKERGYETLAIHPGHNWFYKRESVYSKMGFNDFISLEDLPRNIEKVNYYTADSETTKLIIDNYDKHLKTSDKPYFNFTVTIQNHGPYMNYEAYETPRYVRPEGMSDEMYYTINNYAEGLSCADKMLGDLVEYINTVDKPTYLVFFGDHLPYFDEDFASYDYLGYDIKSDSDEATLNKYRVPFIMCANDAAKTYMRENSIRIRRGQERLISSNYLTGTFLEYMGVSIPKYYQFTNMLSKSVSVISSNYYIADRRFTNTLSEVSEKLIKNYAALQYKNINEYKK